MLDFEKISKLQAYWFLRVIKKLIHQRDRYRSMVTKDYKPELDKEWEAWDEREIQEIVDEK